MSHYADVENAATEPVKISYRKQIARQHSDRSTKKNGNFSRKRKYWYLVRPR